MSTAACARRAKGLLVGSSTGVLSGRCSARPMSPASQAASSVGRNSVGGGAAGPPANGRLEPSETMRSRMWVAHHVRRRSSVSVQVCVGVMLVFSSFRSRWVEEFLVSYVVDKLELPAIKTFRWILEARESMTCFGRWPGSSGPGCLTIPFHARVYLQGQRLMMVSPSVLLSCGFSLCKWAAVRNSLSQ